MFARKKIYGLMMIGAMLLAGCTQDDVTADVPPTTLVPISFDCTPYNYDNNGPDEGASGNENNTTRAVIGQTGTMDSEDLYYTGFGVFASVTATTDKKPDMMYNQEVEFTFVGDMDDPLKGFWSYEPVKYWPANLSTFFISAYAPYQDSPVSAGSDDTGIIGISGQTAMPTITFRRCEKPEECVDLLWYYKDYGLSDDIPTGGKLGMTMHHALSRLEINVQTQDAPATGTKVLIEEITLTGRMAKTGTLHLYEQVTSGSGDSRKYYPIWSDQTYDQDGDENEIDRIITISNDDEDASSYGIIDEQVRYIEGLPYAWQPDGLRADDPLTTTVNEGLQNALSTIDRKTYIYLIPKSSSQSLSVKVKYHVMTESVDRTFETEAIGVSVGKTVGETTGLFGNTTYKLNLTLKDISI